MEAAKKEAEQIMTLENELEKAKEQTQMYSEAMDNLQAEYETLEQENIELRKQVSMKEDKRRSIPMMKQGAFDDESTAEATMLTADNLNEIADMQTHVSMSRPCKIAAATVSLTLSSS